jgi:hypothetical protein
LTWQAYPAVLWPLKVFLRFCLKRSFVRYVTIYSSRAHSRAQHDRVDRVQLLLEYGKAGQRTQQWGSGLRARRPRAACLDASAAAAAQSLLLCTTHAHAHAHIPSDPRARVQCPAHNHTHPPTHTRTWLSSDWQMMAVPAGFGVMAGIECMDGSATYLHTWGDAAHTASAGDPPSIHASTCRYLSVCLQVVHCANTG